MGVAAPAARAELDSSAYEPKTGRTLSPEERARDAKRFEEDRRRAEEREREERERKEAERARLQAELDARPHAVRLTEARCTRCHGAENYSAQGHTWVGWQWVVLRMQWLNDATLGPGERAQIVAHLGETYPAAGARAWAEWGAAAAVAFLALALLMVRFLRWRRGAR